jgi:hypothetical protein
MNPEERLKLEEQKVNLKSQLFSLGTHRTQLLVELKTVTKEYDTLWTRLNYIERRLFTPTPNPNPPKKQVTKGGDRDRSECMSAGELIECLDVCGDDELQDIIRSVGKCQF